MKMKETRVNFASFKALILPSVVVIFGLQALRGFIPGVAWYLRDTKGVGSLNLIPYAFGTFFLGFLAILFGKLLSARLSLWISASGLAALRLIDHVIKDPALGLWLGIASVGLFLIFIPLFISYSRSDLEVNPGRWYQGLVIGFALDAMLRGFFGLQNLKIVGGWGPIVVITILGILVLWSLWQERDSGDRKLTEGHGKGIILLLALGPYFLLQLFYFQSLGWLEEVSGLSFPIGFLIIALGYVASMGGYYLGFNRPRSLHPSLALGSGLLLIYCVYYANQLGIGALGLILIGQFIMGWGLGGISKANLDTSRNSGWRTVLAVNGGMVLFLILAFAFYLGQDIAMPISRDSFPALAAGAYALLMVWASFQVWKKETANRNLTGLVIVSLLVLIPLVFWGFWGKGPMGADPSGFPVQVMSYNIHSAFDVTGRQDLEGIAVVIEDSGADIIGLQEISRTRLMDGGPDMPTWLAGRLDMEMVFAGTEEPIWGNAILSRYPILDSGFQTLPREGSLLGRGFLWAKIDVGEDEPLLVVVTHLHHLHQRVEDDNVRMAQIHEILNFLKEEDHLILLGDLNAKPDSIEIGLIYDAGLVDAWLEAGVGEGFTVGSDNPSKRIDYLWHSPDLQTLEIEVIQTSASDHMPVIGNFGSR